MRLDFFLPPLGNGPRGSRVWCGFPSVGQYRPPFGNRPHGSQPKSSLFPKQAGLFRYKTAQAMPKPLTSRYFCPAPTQAAAEQRGDRQRREKGPLILTAEKGEHERAPRAGESYLTPLRATLRAPPSKWAIKAFFRRVSAASRGRGQPRRGYRRPKPTARSDVGRLRSRRAACFLWYFLSLRKKVLSPSGRQPHRPRQLRRVNPPQGIF